MYCPDPMGLWLLFCIGLGLPRKELDHDSFDMAWAEPAGIPRAVPELLKPGAGYCQPAGLANCVP